MNEIERPVIVVADDDHDICELVNSQLTRHGFQVFAADNGETALQLIGLHRPVVVLLDIMMPKLSGLDVARRVRADPATSQVGIVLFSARSTFGSDDDVDEIGVDDYISKPFSPQDLVQRINAVINHRQTNTPTPNTKGIIIVADDDLDICELLDMKLRQSHYEVHTALDGLQALEMIRRVRPDLVILDIMMPLMSGMDVLREMRTDPAIADIPVILMTARRQEKDVDSGLALGVVDYIIKPFNLKDLIVQVESVISGS